MGAHLATLKKEREKKIITCMTPTDKDFTHLDWGLYIRTILGQRHRCLLLVSVQQQKKAKSSPKISFRIQTSETRGLGLGLGHQRSSNGVGGGIIELRRPAVGGLLHREHHQPHLQERDPIRGRPCQHQHQRIHHRTPKWYFFSIYSFQKDRFRKPNGDFESLCFDLCSEVVWYRREKKGRASDSSQ